MHRGWSALAALLALGLLVGFASACTQSTIPAAKQRARPSPASYPMRLDLVSSHPQLKRPATNGHWIAVERAKREGSPRYISVFEPDLATEIVRLRGMRPSASEDALYFLDTRGRVYRWTAGTDPQRIESATRVAGAISVNRDGTLAATYTEADEDEWPVWELLDLRTGAYAPIPALVTTAAASSPAPSQEAVSWMNAQTLIASDPYRSYQPSTLLKIPVDAPKEAIHMQMMGEMPAVSTSGRVAVAQNPEFPGVSRSSLQVFDRDGRELASLELTSLPGPMAWLSADELLVTVYETVENPRVDRFILETNQ